MMDIKPVSKIYIIESPSKQDLEKGRKEGIAMSEFLKLADIWNDCFAISDEGELWHAIGTIAQEIEKNKGAHGWTAIHFSMHGNQDGIALTSGEFIDWKKFSYIWAQAFTNIVGYLKNPANQKPFCPVHLCFSSCYGLSAVAMKNYSVGSPYFVLIAPSLEINWSDSLMGFAILYHTLIHKKQGFDKAIERMNLVNELDYVFRFDIIEGWGIIKAT